MRWVYLSPHFDDAVLSCGGLMYEQAQQGQAVEIWTICAGSPPPAPLSPLAQRIHLLWRTGSAEETVHLRREEDRQAAARLGANILHGPLPDCIYRRAPNGEALYTQGVFVPWSPLERNLPAQIAAWLSEHLTPEDVLVSPLAIGGHVDHLLVRLAAERLERALRYYADVPYVLKAAAVLQSITTGLASTLHPVSENGMQAWAEAVAAYRSQLFMLFKTEGRMKSALRRYARQHGGLRLWYSQSAA
ncbi:MAG: PIG-L family deacetylase [Anaerolineales bacterium]|nr:PIG-L family deacetylase [Anaerolineales bacterium]MCX7609866.1 PIG-L family deacetylase [Anaerolineales bacterium]MDW8227153.1 PIG-L family deacetylase [Anaerolineales bacterium]